MMTSRGLRLLFVVLSLSAVGVAALVWLGVVPPAGEGSNRLELLAIALATAGGWAALACPPDHPRLLLTLLTGAGGLGVMALLLVAS